MVVHDGAQASRALRVAASAGRPVLLLSPEAASASLGAGYVAAMVGTAGTAVPGARFQAMLDCGMAAGDALAALRAGWRLLRLDASPPAQARIAAIAAALDATVLRDRPPALDLGDPAAAVDDAALARWIASPSPPGPG